MRGLCSLFLFLVSAALLFATPNLAAAPKPDLLVKFRADATSDEIAAVIQQGRLHPRRHFQTAPMAREGHPGLVVASSDMSLNAAIAALRRHRAVEYVEPNQTYTTQLTSNDPFVLDSSTWGMYGDLSSPANAFGSQAAEAWGQGYVGTNSVYVAVIDDGMQTTHPDLAPNVWINPFDPPDGIDNDGNGYVDDVNGWNFYSQTNVVFVLPDRHGTHVAGTIGAKGGNGLGVAGVTWNVTLIPLKFISGGSGTTDDAVQAIDYCVDLKTRHGLNLVAINASWGGTGYSQFLHESIIRAAKAGILFVAAAGNGATNNDHGDFFPANTDTTIGTASVAPASYNAVISVAAIDSSGHLASFSDFGATTVHLGAPGVSILSTYATTAGVAAYARIDGTSMATPHVTGAVALYASTHPFASPERIRSAILGAVIPTPSLNGKTTTGGRLNLSEIIRPLDSDGDGMPDDFEEAYQLNPNDPSDALADWDGDGLSNLQEYLAGTNPLDSRSDLRVTGTQSAENGLTLQFAGANGQQYSVEYNDSFPNPATWLDLSNPTGTGVSVAQFDPGMATVGSRIYRIRAAGGAVQSDSAGFVRLQLLGDSDTLVSLPFFRAAAELGAVSAASDNTVQIRGAPSWMPNQWVYASGIQTNTYYLLIRSGAQEGDLFAILENSTNAVTLDVQGGSISGLAIGDRIGIVPYWTLGTIFPDGLGINASSAPGNRQTEILVPDIAGTGINLAAGRTYYFWNGAWRQVGQGATVKNDDVILPDMFFTVRQNTSAGTELLASGSVLGSAFRSAVRRNLAALQDNDLSDARPVPVSLNQSGLIESGAFRTSSTPDDRLDELYVFDNTVAAKNKSASAAYYYWNTAWRKVGAGSDDAGSDVVFLPGAGVILRSGTGSPGSWTTQATY